MKTKRLLIVVALLVAMATGASAQGLLGKIKEKTIDKAKQKIESKVDGKVDETLDGVLNGKKSDKSKKNDKKSNGDVDAEEGGPEEVDAEYQQSDFVPGAVVFFEDNLQGEQMGEFPSKWDLLEGNAEVANMNGKPCIHIYPGSSIEPLMTDQTSYLPDVFTLEWDVFCSKQGDYGQSDLELNTFVGTTRVGHIKLTFRSWNPDYR